MIVGSGSISLIEVISMYYKLLIYNDYYFFLKRQIMLLKILEPLLIKRQIMLLKHTYISYNFFPYIIS